MMITDIIEAQLTRSKQIEEEVAAGKTVIADRYAFSGIAFSAAKVRLPLYTFDFVRGFGYVTTASYAHPVSELPESY